MMPVSICISLEKNHDYDDDQAGRTLTFKLKLITIAIKWNHHHQWKKKLKKQKKKRRMLTRQKRGYEIMKQNRLHDNDYTNDNWNWNETENENENANGNGNRNELKWLLSCHTQSVCLCVSVCNVCVLAYKNLGQSSEYKQNLDDDGYLTVLNNKCVSTYTRTHVGVCKYIFISVTLGVGVVKWWVHLSARKESTGMIKARLWAQVRRDLSLADCHLQGINRHCLVLHKSTSTLIINRIKKS